MPANSVNTSRANISRLRNRVLTGFLEERSSYDVAHCGKVGPSISRNALTLRFALYSMAMKLTTVWILLFLMSVPALQGKSNNSSTGSDLQSALSHFVTAFDNLDWDQFRQCFEDDATVFYPRSYSERARGRAEFEHTFRLVFEQIRGKKSSAPYMDIQPKDLLIQKLDDNVAIVTFHLGDRPGFLNRRTMVWHRTASGWKIAHLHASEVPVPSGQGQQTGNGNTPK